MTTTEDPKVPMEGRQVPIKDAAYADLVAFARDMGCAVGNGNTKVQILGKMALAGWDKDFILVPQEPVAEEGEAPQQQKPAPKAKAAATAAEPARASKPPANPLIPTKVEEPFVVVQIDTQEGAGGKRHIFVGVNGDGMLMARNKPHRVRLRWLNALRIAVQTVYEINEMNEQEQREQNSVPYQIIENAREADVKAWELWESWLEAKRDGKTDAWLQRRAEALEELENA